MGGAANDNILGLQLLLDGILEPVGVQRGAGFTEQIQFVEVQGDIRAAVGQGHGAGHGADGRCITQIDLAAGGRDSCGLVCIIIGDRLIHTGAGEGLAGGGGQRRDGVEDHLAAGLAGGGDQVGEGAAGGGDHRVVKEAVAEQVGGGGAVGGVLPGKLHQLVGDALVRRLLPLELGVLLLQLGDLLLVALHHALDHGLGVQTAGQAGDDVAVSAAVDTAGG